jgi:hypothetical protein
MASDLEQDGRMNRRLLLVASNALYLGEAVGFWGVHATRTVGDLVMHNPRFDPSWDSHETAIKPG